MNENKISKSKKLSIISYVKELNNIKNNILNSKIKGEIYSPQILDISIKIVNHLEFNNELCNKKDLFLNLIKYYKSIEKNPFFSIPQTFQIKNYYDPEFKSFESFFKINSISKQNENIWILKPGENSNRGAGITLTNNFKEISSRLIELEFEKTLIIQKYIENPLLIHHRKFDIRCYLLITSNNGITKGYVYKEGYVRTSSIEFSLNSLNNKIIHLTNDAIQKNSNNYGKFESNNKLSFDDFKSYLDKTFPNLGINFEYDIFRQIKKLMQDSILAVCNSVDKNKRCNCFELLGYDFMIDENFQIFLIEVNTNPCLEQNCSLLKRLIDRLIDNTLRIVVDPLFPPIDYSSSGRKILKDILPDMYYELIYDSQKSEISFSGEN